MYITDKTLKDLEFDTVLESMRAYALSDLGKDAISKLKPIKEEIELLAALHRTDEFLTSFSNNNRIPLQGFHALERPLLLLGIENTYIEPTALLDITSNITTLHEIKVFLEKFDLLYPHLNEQIQDITDIPEVIPFIKDKISVFAEVEDHASTELKLIRKEKREIESQIAGSFDRALQKYLKLDYLDDIRESVVDGKRVLAVQATHRKKVQGNLLGTSKTGSIIFILPQVTQKLDQDLQLLLLKEQEEIIRILKDITDTLRPYKAVLEQQILYLTQLDVTGAKAKYAQAIQGILPKLSKEKKINLKLAYHPLLIEINRKKGLNVIPQSIELNEKQQIIVISGPNAGGKSITLKTIGLLQVMLQSGILVPVNEKSEMSFFDTILTDIGDNQSIENQLSTYSYRLKNMRMFLKRCNALTLFLIDEFGSGSDPELGGALAEVFFEEFYNKKAFGVITTHYTNIKALADHLENAANANMQFDKQSLQPLYELVTGQAGSSFTFEVAQQNGIPFHLINRAKKRVSGSKVRLDKTISKLQSERNKLIRQSESLEVEKGKAGMHAQELVEKQSKMQEKLEQFYLLYETQQKMLQYGRAINEMANHYFQSDNKKQLLETFQKWIQAEKVKYVKKNPPKKMNKIEKKQIQKTEDKKDDTLKTIEKEVLKEVEVIKEIKQEEIREKAIIIENYQFQVGDTVRIKEGWAQGTVEKVEKKKLLINYGSFTTIADKNQVELVKKVKQ
jgi:DNA mismatch repair protein MutS2